MRYSKFTIQHYRSFQDAQTLKFAQPDTGKSGSGITFIVGENNTGKTTLIEGLFLRDGEKIKLSERQQSGQPCFELYDSSGELKRKLTLIREGSYTLKEEPMIDDSEAFEIIPARRHWQSTTSGVALFI